MRDEPRIVPPRGRMPRTDSIVSSSQTRSSGPRQPSRKPTIEWPWWSMPLRTIARIDGVQPRTVATASEHPDAHRVRNILGDGRPAARRCVSSRGCAIVRLRRARRASRRSRDGRFTIYSSLPRHGVSARAAEAVAAGERLALADAHGRAAGRRVRLVELDDSSLTGEAWDAATVEANAKRAAADPTTIAYLGELDLGGSAVSVPVTNVEGDPPGIAGGRADEPDPGRARRTADEPAALLPATGAGASCVSCRPTWPQAARSSQWAHDQGARSGRARAGRRAVRPRDGRTGGGRRAPARDGDHSTRWRCRRTRIPPGSPGSRSGSPPRRRTPSIYTGLGGPDAGPPARRDRRRAAARPPVRRRARWRRRRRSRRASRPSRC